MLVVALAGVALLAAACSGGSPGSAVAHLGSTTTTTAASGSGSTGSGKSGGLLAYSQCMRSHGLPDFPDPNSQGFIEGKSSSASGGNADDLNPNSPAYQAAQKACQKYVSGGTTPADQTQQLSQALKYAGVHALSRRHRLSRSHGCQWSDRVQRVGHRPLPGLPVGQLRMPVPPEWDERIMSRKPLSRIRSGAGDKGNPVEPATETG